MANTKEYQIKINGLTESINAVESLNKQLDSLEQKMKTISSSKVSAGGGSSASRGSNSALSEEERVQKEINKLKEQGQQLDAKMVAAQSEVYKKVDATKELYKEILADQKAIAAQERLQADAYSNTMVGIKQKLADLKSVHFTTDLSSDEFKKQTQDINALTQQLKELEEEYGVFSRNVGNYKSAFDGFDKIKVTIGGVVKEFDNLNQASKAIRAEMGKLEYNTQQDTAEYKSLEKELEKVAKAQLRLNSAMNDAKASSKAMDDLFDTMESFTALGQVGQGFSTFFGFDNTALEQQIAKLVALQNVLSGIEKIRQQMNTKEGIGKWLSMGSDAVDKFVMRLTGAQKKMGMLVKDTRAATLEVQGLAKALKFIGGAAVAGAIMFATTAIGKLVDDYKKWKDGGYEAGTATDILNKKLNTLRDEMEEINRLNLRMFFDGLISYEAYAATKTDVLVQSLDKLLGKLDEVERRDFSKPTGSILGGINLGYGNDYQEGIDNAFKRFDELAEKLDKLENSSKDSEFLKWLKGLVGLGSDVDHMKREFQELGETLSQDYLATMKSVIADANKQLRETGEISKETKDYIVSMAKALGPRNKNSLAPILDNVDKFSKKGQYYANQIKLVSEQLKDLARQFERIEEVDPDRMMQLEIDAMKDGLAKQRAQIALNRKKELADAQGDAELMKAINAKYRREELEAEKAYGKEYKSALADLASIRIEMMNEGWAKEKAQLEHERDERIRAIVDSEILVGERTKAVRALYNKKIAKAEKEWKQQQLEAYRDYLSEIEMMNRETYAMEVSNSLQNVDNRAYEKKNKEDKFVNKDNYKAIRAMKEYYQELLKIELDAANQEEAIRQEALRNELDDAKKDEEIRHQRLVDANNGEYAKQLEKGLITQKQYDELIQKEEAAHFARLNALEKKYAADSTRSTQDNLEDKYNAYNTYYQKLTALLRKKQDDIANQLDDSKMTKDRQSRANFGFFNAEELGKAYDEAIAKQKETIAKIRTEMDNLDKDNKAGKVIGEAYEQRREELEASLRAGIKTLKTFEDESMAIVDEVVGNINKYFQVLGQSVQQIFQAVWEFQDYENEKEQDELDKRNEELKESLDKQRDIIEEHKNNVDSIEDELATARGDRRQHLIDQLNAEISAQRAAQKEEQRIQKEQEQLKKKEEALEKKRREQEYKRNVMQAFISWHLAIANGLATQPFLPVGIAMGALATALGAVQYALVKSQKPYAKGGQLDGGVAQGARHRDGGIPVLGGRASIEGGEFITNRRTTAQNVDLLEFVNSKHRKLNIDDFVDFYSTTPRKVIRGVRTKFEDGGYLPTLPSTLDVKDQLQNIVINQDNRPIVVSVVDINNKQDQVRRVQTLAGL